MNKYIAKILIYILLVIVASVSLIAIVYNYALSNVNTKLPHVIDEKPMHVSDKKLMSVDQQRELIENGSVSININGEAHTFVYEDGYVPEELRQYLWAYQE